MRNFPGDVAFTPAVKGIQQAKGSRAGYAKVEQGRGWQTRVTPDLAEFLADLDMFHLGTANAEGQPYIQYRGGSPGFLKVLDEKTLAFADFGGNRQYNTLGNLSENPKTFIFLKDYAISQRVKVWGTAKPLENEEGAASTAITHTAENVFMTESRSQVIESPIKCPSTALSNRRSGRVPSRPTPSG